MQKIDTLQPDLQESLKFLLRLKQLDESARAMGLANIYELPLEMEKIVSQMENMRARAEKMKKQLENIEREIKEGKIIWTNARAHSLGGFYAYIDVHTRTNS